PLWGIFSSHIPVTMLVMVVLSGRVLSGISGVSSIQGENSTLRNSGEAMELTCSEKSVETTKVTE
ncbi:MAG: hypothetical protein VYC98_10370, partial [Planctomycetota bacterium]|nr:hypothetical protein [Planctomycetota bacterium]